MIFYRTKRSRLLAVILVLYAGETIKAEDKSANEFPHFSAELAQGREVWLQNCKTCHAYGIAGAPIPSVPKQWSQRLQSPLSQLYQHAIEGFYGATDTHMPARGGNPALTDAEVTAAVDYMLALANHHLSTTKD